MRAARAANKKRNHVWRIKIISAGDQSVGKSCLIKRYCDGKFVGKYIPTVGIDYGVKGVKCGPYEVRINFFDMAGPDDYKEVRNEFYSEAQACLLVYDASSMASFQRLHLWVAELKRYGAGNVATLVVANKADLRREVDYAVGKHWADAQGFKFAEVSAKSGEGVKSVFDMLILDALESWKSIPTELLTAVRASMHAPLAEEEPPEGWVQMA